jgi:hypothetical protein
MAKHTADRLQAVSLEGLLEDRGLNHLRVRRHGDLLVLESGPDHDAHPHARFRRLGAHIWRLEMPVHTGSWEGTPFRGQIQDLLSMLETDFPWTLAPIT